MKTINKSILAATGVILGMLSCSEPELPSANTYTPGATYKSNFSFANATVDAPSLDFYVNGIKLGSAAVGIGSVLPTVVPIASPGVSGGFTANTSIRAKATSGTIGGKVGSNDLIFRSSANGLGNFSSVHLANYTVIAIDSLNRPVPVRLSRKTATISFADVTFWNPNTGKMISASRRDSLNPANCPACVNWDGAAQTPSTATEYANLVAYGNPVNPPALPPGTATPLGITDPGGVRFYVLQDNPLTFTGATAPTNAGIRLINAVANSNGIAAAANANGTFGGPPIYVRLRPAAGPNITLATNSVNPVSQPGGFNPNVGSRSAGVVAFTSQTIATAGVPIAYTLEVAFDAAYTNIAYSAPVSFTPGKNYTVFIRGRFTSLTGIQPLLGYGIITH